MGAQTKERKVARNAQQSANAEWMAPEIITWNKVDTERQVLHFLSYVEENLKQRHHSENRGQNEFKGRRREWKSEGGRLTEAWQ